ncbi:MAG: hypothetical protein ACRD0C_01825 [Acidimicrobiia bacterium]
MAIWGVLALAVTGAAPASAGPGDFFGGSDRLSVRGAAASQGDGGGYGLGVWARTAGEAEEASGQFRYGHRGPDGEYGVAGNVHCLARDAAGLIQVSGRVFASGGQNFVGKDFAATIDVDGSPQRFSDLKIGEAGSFAPCSGGESAFHPVTEGGYEARGGGK